MKTLLTIFILVLIFLFTFACVLGLYALFCRIEQRRAYNEPQQEFKKDVTAGEVAEQARQLLHEVDLYITCRETPQQINKVRHQACDLLNAAIELRNQSRNL